MLKKLWSGLWSGLKEWLYKWFGSLVMEEKSGGKIGLSLGRTLLLCVMTGMGAVWWKSFQGMSLDLPTILAALPDSKNATELATALLDAAKGAPEATMPDGMMEVFYALSGYVFGTKFTDALKKKWGK